MLDAKGVQKFFNGKTSDPIIKLPEPDTHGSVSLEEAIENRASTRNFNKASVPLNALAQLCWAGQGIVRNADTRSAPSAGATYPVELYVVAARVDDLKPGVYHYDQREHSLNIVKKGKFSKPLKQAALGQDSIDFAPLCIVVTAQFSRTEQRYGSRARRYVFMETGHVGQNIQLQACTLGLGSVVIGAFRDEEVQEVLGIAEEAVYVIPVGRPE